MELLYSRSFVLHTSDGQTSKPHRLKNGLAQGSVLAPILYNIYTSDFPATLATRYMYADDEALKASAHTTSEIERSLSVDMQTVSEYLKKMETQTICFKNSVFHLPSEELHGRLSTSSLPWWKSPEVWSQTNLPRGHLRSEPNIQGPSD